MENGTESQRAVLDNSRTVLCKSSDRSQRLRITLHITKVFVIILHYITDIYCVTTGRNYLSQCQEPRINVDCVYCKIIKSLLWINEKKKKNIYIYIYICICTYIYTYDINVKKKHEFNQRFLSTRNRFQISYNISPCGAWTRLLEYPVYVFSKLCNPRFSAWADGKSTGCVFGFPLFKQITSQCSSDSRVYEHNTLYQSPWTKKNEAMSTTYPKELFVRRWYWVMCNDSVIDNIII